jgi:hypothetical protein
VFLWCLSLHRPAAVLTDNPDLMGYGTCQQE